MDNNVFGTTMENIRNHKDMKLVTSDKKYLKYVMKPNFKGGHPFSKYFCRGDGRNRDYDELASVPWAGNIRSK